MAEITQRTADASSSVSGRGASYVSDHLPDSRVGIKRSVGVDDLANEEGDEEADLSVEDDAAGPVAPGGSVSNREDGKHYGDNDGRDECRAG